MAIRIGIVGFGKIARDQHLPTIEKSTEFELVAVASPDSPVSSVPTYRTLDEMLLDREALEAVALCQPPQVRFDAAVEALNAGRHVFLEKPPGATLSEVESLIDLANARGVTLFASWHSRYASGVEVARAWISERQIRSVQIDWKEDVRQWHPGQTWIWQPGGMGVFDPGINALSIATRILPAFHLHRGQIAFPGNRSAPIAADLDFATVAGAPIHAAFDWRQTGLQTWDVRVETDDGVLLLSNGGSTLTIDGVPQLLADEAEYPGLYRRFAELIRGGRSDVDLSPMRHVADTFMRAERVEVEAFED